MTPIVKDPVRSGKIVSHLKNNDESKSSAHYVPVPVAVLVVIAVLVVPVTGKTVNDIEP